MTVLKKSMEELASVSIVDQHPLCDLAAPSSCSTCSIFFLFHSLFILTSYSVQSSYLLLPSPSNPIDRLMFVVSMMC